MNTQCPVCSAPVDADPIELGRTVKCERCGAKLSPPPAPPHSLPKVDDTDGLGIHPALLQRHRNRGVDGSGEMEIPASVQLSPSLVSEVNEVDPGTSLELPSRDKNGQTRPLSARFAKPGEPPAAPEDAPEIPGYILQKTVGKGAMGRVYQAICRDTGSAAAVKVLAPELAARPDFVARFEREAAALRAVEHPFVVSIIGSGSNGDVHFLAMDFVDGRPLRQELAKGSLSPLRALHFARQIAQGLAAAHGKGVVHRDLKPENILVQGQGDDECLVLVDFGLAGMAEDNDPHPNLTKSRMTMGTVNYMAPEQRTDAKRVDARADLYSNGVILYEMLTGDLPLGRFKLPSERGLPLPESIDDCLGRALDREREKRFQTAEDLDATLADIEAELVHAASQDTVIGRYRETPPQGSADAAAKAGDVADDQNAESGAAVGDAATLVDESLSDLATDSSDSALDASALNAPAQGTTPATDASFVLSAQSNDDAVEPARGRPPGQASVWKTHPLPFWGTLAVVFVGAALVAMWNTSSSDDGAAPSAPQPSAPSAGVHPTSGAAGSAGKEGMPNHKPSPGQPRPNKVAAVGPDWAAGAMGWTLAGKAIRSQNGQSTSSFLHGVKPEGRSGFGVDARLRFEAGSDANSPANSAGYGGVFYWNPSHTIAVGLIALQGEGCQLLELRSGKMKVVGKMACPSHRLQLRCSSKQASCRAIPKGKGKGVEFHLPELSTQNWTLALGCKSATCIFDQLKRR